LDFFHDVHRLMQRLRGLIQFRLADAGTRDVAVDDRYRFPASLLGIPLRFTGGRPATWLPALSVTEAHQFQAAHAKLSAAYEQLRDKLSTHPDHSEFARLL